MSPAPTRPVPAPVLFVASCRGHDAWNRSRCSDRPLWPAYQSARPVSRVNVQDMTGRESCVPDATDTVSPTCAQAAGLLPVRRDAQSVCGERAVGVAGRDDNSDARSTRQFTSPRMTEPSRAVWRRAAAAAKGTGPARLIQATWATSARYLGACPRGELPLFSMIPEPPGRWPPAAR